MDPSTSCAMMAGMGQAAAGTAPMEEDGNQGCRSMAVDGGSAESHRLYLARRTVLEMLYDRGYGVSLTEIEWTLAEFRAVFGGSPDLDRLRISAVLLRDPAKRLLVVFCGLSKVKLSTVRDLHSQFGKEDLSRMILVLQSEMSSKARENMKDLFSCKVEVFQISDLLINITKHVLMPYHEPLSAEAKQELLKKYNIVETQLPRMLENDAIARYYGYERGTVIRITYDSELTRKHITYRCVM